MRLIGGNISDTPVKEIADGSAFNVGGAVAVATAPLLVEYGAPARLEATVPTVANYKGMKNHCKSIWKIKDNYYGFLFRDSGDSNKAYFQLLTIDPATGVPTASTKVDISANHASGNYPMAGVTMASASTTATLVLYTVDSSAGGGHTATHNISDCTVTFSTGALSSITGQTDAFDITTLQGSAFHGMIKMSSQHVAVFESANGGATLVTAKGCKVAATRAVHAGTDLSGAVVGNTSGVGVVGAYNEVGDDDTGFVVAGTSGSSIQRAWKLSINTSTNAITEVGTATIPGSTTYTTYASCTGATQNIGDDLYFQSVLKQANYIDTSSGTPVTQVLPEPHLVLTTVVAHADGAADMVVLDNNRYVSIGHIGGNSGPDLIMSGFLYEHGVHLDYALGDTGTGHDSEAAVCIFGLMASSTSATILTVIYTSDADSGNLRYYTVTIS